MRAKSIKGESPEEIRSALNESLQDGFTPSLAIVFISVKQNRDALCDILNSAGIDIIGATSAGEFIDNHQSDGAIAILLLDLSKEYYQIIFSETKDTDVIIAAKDAVNSAKQTFSRPAFIVCSTSFSSTGKMYESDRLIHGIVEEAGNETPVFGAMSGDDYLLEGTFIFTNHQTTDEGFIILALDNDRIDLHGMAISGWKPLGKVRTVTKADGEWLLMIDDQPALDMYLRYLGQSIDTEVNSSNFRENIAFYYPFLSVDGGEPSLRTPMIIDNERKAVRLDFAIPEGKQLQFTLPPDFDIVESVLNKAAELKQQESASADALLVFSCLGRRTALGPMIQEENDGLHRLWDVPMAGFFSYGEYGKDPVNDNVFHSTTCSWVALKEK
ncbi:FIST C-terminal domain-containing protein [Terrimonas sp. NA20]|uniref:FIST C-terminal domain-containing protein n=1 Tax=Terrimonas ginsenosidimutans TaxID=2908004 RepID=A0ABS9KLU8_9BACT|nr:FIST N-terminal domain-containing protein [Terrimonas ginsenosidimutans]MCG2613292.1 FIST C-terminal domain-containing protein [Terrimonas ginsenosidimutans]